MVFENETKTEYRKLQDDETARQISCYFVWHRLPLEQKTQTREPYMFGL